MAIETGIKWTDSTSNPWWGCTKVEGAPACLDCYAEDVDKRGTAKDQPLHWGHGAARRRVSEKARNEPYRWQKNADKFFAEHGRAQRVFTLSMGDLLDNEVDRQWRSDHMGVMEDCDRLEWQICTKRISNLPKMIWPRWEEAWPQHIGVLITVVTQKEADRDIPRLLGMKRRFGIPWVGVSYEPAQEYVNFEDYLSGSRNFNSHGEDITPSIARLAKLDWIIFGGKSGSRWNDGPFDIQWAVDVNNLCSAYGVPFFMKQVAAFRPTDAMIPADLMVRQWPKGH
ncbi:phage Gp37/Gp68 family protein [Mesorhizobium sp. M0189]|uniref:DUF5131 family protein n=1 Tax=Mesorhizobium sp. M0189 TaxID=2956909 RepID=UPI0033362FD3